MERTQEQAKALGRRTKIIFFAVNALVIALILSCELAQNGAVAPQTSTEISFGALLLAFGCFGAALMSEYLKYRLILSSSAEDYRRGTAFGCAVWGKYYDNITPMGSGGQAFQMYYLRQCGYSAGLCGAAPILGFLSLQFAFVLPAMLVLPLGGQYIESAPLRISAWIGLVGYAIIPLCVILFSFAPKKLEAVIAWGCALLTRLRLLKKPEAANERVSSVLSDYTRSMELLWRRPAQLLTVLALSLLFRLSMLSLPWFVLRFFGADAAFWPVFCKAVYISAAITLIPSPGNAGAAEGSFYLVFSLAGNGLSWSVLLWRGLCYYSWLLLGFFYQLFAGLPLRTKGEGSAQFIDVFFPTLDGVVYTVDAYAQRLNPQGRCAVIAPRSGRNREQGRGYSIFHVPSIPLPFVPFRLPLPGLSRSLRRYLKQEPFAVFHVHSPFTMGHYALRMGRRLGIPVVASFHSKYYDDILSISGSRLLARILTRYIVRFYERSDEVWVCSRSTADTLRSYGYRGELYVMQNGTNLRATENPESLRMLARDRFRLPLNKNLLLFVGQQIWQKNLRLVLDSMRLLKRKSPGFLLLVAGDGYHAGEIRSYAEQIGVSDCVCFLGKICDRELLTGLYLSADLLFFPSVYDNAPLVLREAAAAALPALVAEGSNAAEIIQDGVNGFCAPVDAFLMAEKIEFIFECCHLYRIGQQAKQSIPVSWDEVVEEVRLAYQRLTATKSVRRRLAALRLPEASQGR